MRLSEGARRVSAKSLRHVKRKKGRDRPCLGGLSSLD